MVNKKFIFNITIKERRIKKVTILHHKKIKEYNDED